MRLLAMVFCVCALGACFEEETEKAVLAPGPSSTGHLASDGGVECYDGFDCFAFDAGSPEPCFVDEAGEVHCASPADAGVEEPCVLDADGNVHCPLPVDAGFEEPCLFDGDGGVHCPSEPQPCLDEAALDGGAPCGLEPDAGFDPYA